MPPAGVDESGFTRWLDELPIEWVHAARRLSPRLVMQMLDWTNDQVADVIDGQDLSAVVANASWASNDPVPAWLDLARQPSKG